jgi:hypothetical protein
MLWRRIFVVLGILTNAAVFAQDLTVDGDDLWISLDPRGGYNLFVRKKPDIQSVLLVETTRDPELREPNYTYRTETWNPVNGDELRIIDGAVLPQRYSWSLVDSTPEYVEDLKAEVFHIYIPYVIYYGYPTTRNGEVYVGDGTYINIRAFNLPYADYRGRFLDNPFLINVKQDELPAAYDVSYLDETEDAFDYIARETGGLVYRATGPDNLVETIGAIVDAESGGDIDILFCLDTTASMRPYLAAMRKQLVESANDIVKRFNSVRVGMVLFRDYRDAYLTRTVPWTGDLPVFQEYLNALQAAGGGDLPEAVNEALYEAASKVKWRDEADKIIILIGDAPPHPEPRGNVTSEMAISAAGKHGIRVNAIILPQ